MGLGKQVLILLVAIFAFMLIQPLAAQDRAYVSRVVRDLAAPQMHGRAYYKNGDHKAAAYLEREMKKAGISSINGNYKQEYRFTVNSFPSRVAVKVDGKPLQPGEDFVVSPSMGSLRKSYDLLWLPDTLTKTASVFQLVDTTDLKGKMLVLPDAMGESYRRGIRGVPALVQRAEGNIWWHVSRRRDERDRAAVKIKKESLPEGSKQLSLDVKSKLLVNRKAYNVVGLVEGHVQPDSFVVFVAHYDHLGRMGKKALFPGASDNASGTAAVLDLGRYYVSNPEKAYYSMVFLLVSGEEAGLLGSRYFADHPLIPLEKTRFVFNFDMVGTGSEGLSVVNGLVYPEAFRIIETINQQQELFQQITARGESCNSDHCPFHQKGVPAVFLFTRGRENRHYHNTADLAVSLPFTRYEQLFTLVTAFIEQLPVHPAFVAKQ